MKTKLLRLGPVLGLACLIFLPSAAFALPAAYDGKAAPQRAAKSHWLEQAKALEKKQDWPALLAWAESWIDADGRNPMAWYVQGRAMTELKNHAGAVGAYLQTLRLDPKDVYALNNLGNAYRQIGRYHDALLAYREAIRVNPNCSRAWHNMGVTYYGLKGQAGVLEALKEADAINPEIAAAWQQLMRDYAFSHDDRAALQAVRGLGRQNPAELDRLFNTLLSRLN